MIKLCKDCKFCPSTSFVITSPSWVNCMHDMAVISEPEINLVTGYMSQLRFTVEEMRYGKEQICGKDGKLFEDKKQTKGSDK